MTVLPAGTLKRLHVNQHVIRANREQGRNDPPLTVKTRRGNYKAWAVQIAGPSTLLYRPAHPLACGARVWLQTKAEVRVDAADRESDG